MDVPELRPVSGWWYVGAGVLIGLAAGVWLEAALEERDRTLEAGGPPPEEKPGLVQRLIQRIPMRVKVAAGVGAVKSGGGEAMEMARERWRGER